jgi:hypothetical protein
MNYIIYNIESTLLLMGHNKRYATRAAAKGALTRISKKANLLSAERQAFKNKYAIASILEFHNNIEKMVTRINLMSKKEYQERVNTPIYCSPAYESYWSM